MEITNKYDLPNAFVEMAKSEYKVAPNEYRVTSLLKGPRETILERRYHDQIEVDVVDMIWALWGSAVHHVLENQKLQEGEIRERRIKLPLSKYIISGQFDLFDENKKQLTDYKTSSVWKYIYGNFEDWRRQLLIYAYLLRHEGIDVDKGQVVAIFRDFRNGEAKRTKGYPKLPVAKIPFQFTEEDLLDIEEWLYYRIALFSECEKLEDYELPVCTPEERFNSGDKYAVMKKGRKKALRVLDSEQEAEKWIQDNGKGDYVEYRPGEDRKCRDHCYVNKFCSYYRENIEPLLKEVS